MTDQKQEIFSIGEMVWVADIKGENDYIPCPVCYGKTVVIVILGNGNQVETPCGYCQHGFDAPQGQVQAGSHLCADAHPNRITGIDTRTNDKGEIETTYWFGCIGGHADSVARTREEAIELGKLRAIKYTRQNYERVIDLAKHNIDRSYAWNVGYHMKAAERAKQELAYHEAKAKLLQTKVKSESVTKGHP